MARVAHERTVEKKAAEKRLFACPETQRTSDREYKDGVIGDQEARKGQGLILYCQTGG